MLQAYTDPTELGADSSSCFPFHSTDRNSDKLTRATECPIYARSYTAGDEKYNRKVQLNKVSPPEQKYNMPPR